MINQELTNLPKIELFIKIWFYKVMKMAPKTKSLRLQIQILDMQKIPGWMQKHPRFAFVAVISPK